MSENIFKLMRDAIKAQQEIIESISKKIDALETIGGGSSGGGTASIEDYESGRDYDRNTLVVDTDTETVYRVINKYTSVDVKNDCASGNLKLVGFESQIVEFNHDPTQKEISVLPKESFVAVYNPSDQPYIPDLKE